MKKPAHEPPTVTVTVFTPRTCRAAGGSASVTSGKVAGFPHEHQYGGVYVPMATPLTYTVRTDGEHSTPGENVSVALSTAVPAGVVSVNVNASGLPPQLLYSLCALHV